MKNSGGHRIKGRGATCSPDNRFHKLHVEDYDDGWGTIEEPAEKPLTQLFADNSKSIISYNQSPDVPFDRSINPYRGCEHGCVYCFARPAHAYLDCSPGLDFETKIFYKPNAASLLKNELGKRSYSCKPVALGINTDAYQPVERKLKITRKILEILSACRHPVSIVTKSALIERDMDILREMAQHNLVHIMVSVTSLNPALARLLEPRAVAPHRRLQVIETLSQAGIPVGVLVAPVIPVLNDHEIEAILRSVKDAGALTAGYVLLRLPHETRELFSDWLQTHVPDMADHVMNRIRDMRGGKAYDARFGDRMRGTGIFAELIQQRFAVVKKRLQFPGMPAFNTELFTMPDQTGNQMTLF